MRYFKMVIYTTGGDFETREWLIDEPTFRQYQKAIAEGGTHLVLEDRVIKVSSIKEIMPATSEVREYLAQGYTLKGLGLPERGLLEGAPQVEKLENVSELLKEKYLR